jgi:hypothetical protein
MIYGAVNIGRGEGRAGGEGSTCPTGAVPHSGRGGIVSIAIAHSCQQHLVHKIMPFVENSRLPGHGCYTWPKA